MQTIAAFEAKTHLSKLLIQVEQGEEFMITKHGHAVAKIIPIKKINHITKAEAIQCLKVFGQKNRLNGVHWKSLRDEGRR